MKTSDIFKEHCKSLSLPAFVDEVAARCPDQLYASIPVDENDITKGWQDISFGGFAQSVDKVAWWLYQVLGKGERGAEPIHFFLPNDLGSLIFVLASCKAGYKGIFCHPEATAETHVSINNEMDCRIIVFSGEMPQKAKDLYSTDPTMRIFAAPPLGHWMQGPTVAHFDHKEPVSGYKKTALAVVHSSGSTGVPKAITITQWRFMSMVSSLICCQNVDRLNYSALRGCRVATLVPTTIAAGLFHNLGANFCFDYSIVLRPSTGPLSLPVLDTLIHNANVSALAMSPKILPELVQDQALFQKFRDAIKTVIYVGAPLPHQTGDILAQYVNLSSAYGSTETGVYPIYVNAPEDWAYYEYDPAFKNALQPIGELGYHEVVIPRSENLDGPFQSVFDLFPQLKEWRTRDIFLQHKSSHKKHLWRYAGRSEDLIPDKSHCHLATSNSLDGAFLPNDMEAIISSHQQVGSVVVCENRAGHIAIVVEPLSIKNGDTKSWDSGAKEEFVRLIWPHVESVNTTCPVSAGIRQELVIVASEPLRKGAKGYPQRQNAQEKYSDVIDAAYFAFLKSSHVSMSS